MPDAAASARPIGACPARPLARRDEAQLTVYGVAMAKLRERKQEGSRLLEPAGACPTRPLRQGPLAQSQRGRLRDARRYASNFLRGNDGETKGAKTRSSRFLEPVGARPTRPLRQGPLAQGSAATCEMPGKALLAVYGARMAKLRGRKQEGSRYLARPIGACLAWPFAGRMMRSN